MKVKKVLLIFLLFFLFIGAVSASDNVTVSNDINVTFDEQVYEGDLGDISVELPENTTGVFSVKIDNEVIYNETITNTSFKVPIKLPERYIEIYPSVWPSIDCKVYNVNAYLNDVDLNINKKLTVMRFSPDFNYLSFPDEVLKGQENLHFAFPRSSNAMVEIYIDDELINRTKARPTMFLGNLNLDLGNHTLKVLFYNDTYYKDINKTANFTVVDVKITIPETLNINHDDCISVDTLQTGGTVKVYIDSKLISDEQYEKYYVLSLEKFIKTNSSEVTVVYENGNVTRSKTQAINITYDFDVMSSKFFNYDDVEKVVTIILPDTLNNDLLEISINGTRYDFVRPSYAGNNFIDVDISDLDVGSYSMFIKYPGDERFVEKNKTVDIRIAYRIHGPVFLFDGDDYRISVNLPKDADGNLVVYVNDEVFKKAQVKNGHAEINIGSLKPGYYKLRVEYDGDDYNVTPFKNEINLKTKLISDSSFTAGEDKYLRFEIPSASNGYVIVNVDGRQDKVKLVNGTGKYSLKNLKANEYDIDVEYYIDDKYAGIESSTILVKKPQITITSYKITSKSVYVKIKLSKAIKGTMLVSFNGKTYKIYVNKGVGVFKKSMNLKKSAYNVKFSILGSSLSKNIYKANLKIIKSKKKMTLKTTVNVKGVTVKFKINNKVYTAKTNSKGIAQITVNKPKVKLVKCQSSFFGSSFSKKIKV